MEQILTQYMPALLAGAWITVQLTVVSIPLALVIGFGSALLRQSDWWIVRAVSATYVEFFRGTSELVQLFWLFYVLPYFGIRLEPFTVGVLTLGLNLGAYGSEVVRGAILAVPRGQYEACTAINMSKWRAMRRVILPQAIPLSIPPWGNLLIQLLKSTALLSLITIHELTFQADQLNNDTFETTTIFSLALLLYLIMALILTFCVRLVERRFGGYVIEGDV